MQGFIRMVVVLVLTAIVPVAVFAAGGKSIGKDSGVHPAHLEPIPGTDMKKVTLTPKAAERTGIELDEVKELQVPNKRGATDRVTRRVVPYSSLIYTPEGRTWVYTSPENLTFVRHEIAVAYIDGDMVVLSDGPPAGTKVVSIGAAEVYGSEFEVGH